MKKENNKKFAKGFTLLELLVVVVIIGILAAIALPQYQMAVGKAKFSTLKEFTRSVAEARNRYFLTNSEYPKSAKDLDIDLDIVTSSSSPGSWFKFTTSQDITCMVWTFDNNVSAGCNKSIFGKKIHYYIKPNGYSPKSCLVYSEDEDDKANKLCAQETGRQTANNCTNDGGGKYCVYDY